MKLFSLFVLAVLSVSGFSEELSDKNLEGFVQFSPAKDAGLNYGTSVLPPLLANSNIQDNLKANTILKGCEFVVALGMQDKEITQFETKEMVDGCVVGYLSYLKSPSDGILVNPEDIKTFEH